MKLSTRARYGLRLCFLLSISSEETVTLPTLAQNTSLSEKYLEQIISKLRVNNIVESKRGTNGGYRLSRDPSEITINEILTALDDNFEFTDCASGECGDIYCPNKKMFKKLYEGINDFLTKTTLKSMVDEYRC